MKILFIQDNAINESLALTELSSLLKSRGHECALLLEKEERNLFKAAEKFSPDMVIIPFGILAQNFALRIAKEIKKRTSAIVVFAGAHPTFYPEIIRSPFVDVVCRGEAERPILNMADALERNEDITGIKGLWVKKGRRIYKNNLGALIENLDELPLPDRELYYRYDFIKNMPMKRFMSGRGCVNNCTYCFNPSLRCEYRKTGAGKYTRKKSPDRMVEEIASVRDNYPLKTVHFSDDLFTFNKPWVEEFCKKYKKEINLPFTFNTSADQIDRATIKNVSCANCAGIAIGIETGNEELRKIILNKKISNAQIIKGSSLIKGAGLKLATFNMLANPGETIKDAFLTMELNQKIRVDNPRVTISHPIINTELFNYATEGDYLNRREFEKMSGEKYEKPYTKPFYKSREMDAFENLFHLFRIGCKHAELTPLIKKLVNLPRNRLFSAGNLIFALDEKKFFGIPLLEGTVYYMHCGDPFLRTTNYSSIA